MYKSPRALQRRRYRLSVLRTVLVAVTIIALIPAIISSRILANRMTRPIQQMTRTMTDIQSSGQFRKASSTGGR